MGRALVIALVAFAVALSGCGGDDDDDGGDTGGGGTTTSASGQAQQTPGKAVRCSQRSFRVAFDPEGTIVVAAADDNLASLSETDQTVSGRCTIAREAGPFDQAGLTESSAEKVTLTCNVRAPADFVVRGTNLVIAVRPQAIVSATVGDRIQWSNVCLPEEDR